MKTRILNKNFQHPADGWYHIEALGNHPNRAAGVMQVIDAESAQSIVRTFNAEAKAGKLRHGNEMLIDHEHFSDQQDQETRAYGWLQELQNRDDGIYGRIRWTTTGQAAVDGGDYRFFSTEYAPEDLQPVNGANNSQAGKKSKLREVRPMRLDGLTLTNMNNNRGQKPITNRMKTENEAPTLAESIQRIMNGGYIGQEFKGNQYATGDEHGPHNEASKQAHLAGNDADDEASHNKAALMHERAANAQEKAGNDDAAASHRAAAQYHEKCAAECAAGDDDDESKKSAGDKSAATAAAPAANNRDNKNDKMKNIAEKLGVAAGADEAACVAAITKLQNRLTELETEQVEGLLAGHKITDEKVINRLKPVLLNLKNREERVSFLDECLPAPSSGGNNPKTPQKKLHNRDTTPPGNEEGDEATTEDKASANKIMNRAQELQKQTPKLSLATAVRMAQREQES